MMRTRKISTFRIDEELLDGLQEVWDRDGIQPSEQVRRAIRAWLEAKGVMKTKAERKRDTTRKRS